MNDAVKLLLATPRVAAGEFGTGSPGFDALPASVDAKAPGQRGLGALLLHALGDARGTRALDTLSARPGSASSSAVAAMLLETAWTHGLRPVGGWALRVADQPGHDPRLEALALKVAVRFGQPGADDGWSRRVRRAIEDDDLSALTRLVWLALDIAPWMDRERFEPLLAHPDPLVADLGRVANQLASFTSDAQSADRLHRAAAGLLESPHPGAWRWAARHAVDTHDASLAQTLLLKPLPEEPRGRTVRLEAVVKAVGLVLAQPQAPAFFSNLLSRPDTPADWQQAVLLGLVRHGGPRAQDTAARLPDFDDPQTQALLLVLRLRHPGPLSKEDQAALSALIQNSRPLDDSLRAQTAWTYLKHTGQGPEAVRALLAPPARIDD